ncbi:hypothetical protein JCM14076_27460 [Methylosoma difficile]
MTTKKSIKAYLPMTVGGIVLLAAIWFIVDFISNMEEKPARKEKKIQPITLLKPPPPPPPPPKVEEPPPPEQEKVEEVQEEAEPEPEEIPDVAEPPPGDLGLDAEGSAGSDGFGLAARKGGKGLLGGGEGGDPFAWYHGIIKNEILDLLSENEELRKKDYTAIVEIWVEPDGTIKRFQLSKGSNHPDIDELLAKMIGKYKRVSEPSPPGMAQLVKLRIKSKI